MLRKRSVGCLPQLVMFDPVGRVCPYTNDGRIVFQNLCWTAVIHNCNL